MANEQEMRVLARVLSMLGSQPTVQNLDDYLIGYQVLGNLVAVAQGESEQAELDRKIAWATEFSRLKSGEGKLSDRASEALADIATADLRKLEVKTHERWTKLKNTRESVWEAINAMKFLGRNGG